MAHLLRFVASRRRPNLVPPPELQRVQLSALVDNLQIITAYDPLALKLCAVVAEYYAGRIRRGRRAKPIDS